MACMRSPSCSSVGRVTSTSSRMQVLPARFLNTSAKAKFREAETIAPPYTVLITGSTKGVGLALAEEFLDAGDAVFICSRTDTSVRAVVSELSDRYGTDRVAGAACDVSKAADVKALVEQASASLGDIDIWINNAGSNAYSFKPLVEASETDLVDIVQTNVLGVMICCQAAIKAMRRQKAGGHIFNMDGAGADGNPTPRFAAYGATKRALSQLNKSLEAELKLAPDNRVGIHNLSPGMVTTELLMSGANTPQAKFFINCLAETPDVVAQNLVPRIREVPQKGRTPATGADIRFLTPVKAYTGILSRLLFGKKRNRFVREDDDAKR
eukprot:jgi/Ulvmu1/12070/UM083_0083.1